MTLPSKRAERRPKTRRTDLTAVVADRRGRIFELEGYAAVGMAGPRRTVLTAEETVPMPFGGELMLLPERPPVVWNRRTRALEVLRRAPYDPQEPLFAVAAFNSPGYVQTLVSAYDHPPEAAPLPLFSYGAVGWGRGGFRSPLILVDREKRQDLRRMAPEAVRAGVARMRRRMPDNRLRRHLETCALEYGCPAGKNFFLGRFEAPLPTSRACNARCLGCLSLQGDGEIPCSQERIAFTPTPEEIAEVALAHIERVPRAVVSFGQGCEGDPLLAAEVIEPAIRLIRGRTAAGTINLNTNGSLPAVVERLCRAGLDSLRVSLNSVRPACYEAYFRPQGFGFDDVGASIQTALTQGRFVALNYLHLAGFTDTPAEVQALEGFLQARPANMIQWRNLNFDPVRYWKAMDAAADNGPPLGMEVLLQRLRQRFPRLIFGYFNPPKEKFAPADAPRSTPRRRGRSAS